MAQEIEKIREQLLKMMNASKLVIDARKTSAGDIENISAIQKLQQEYIQSIVLMKSLNRNKVPALLNPNHNIGGVSRQVIDFKECLQVGLDED